MCLISVPNLKQSVQDKIVFSWFKVNVLNWCKEEEKCEETRAIFKMHTLQATDPIFF